MNNSSQKIKAWIHAMRLRTLPLAVSGIITGSAVAKADSFFSYHTLLWALITAILLQILSNFANDYGDFVKGTDNDKRIGNKRALQSGLLSPSEMKLGLYITGILALLSGIYLLKISVQTNAMFFVFFALGIIAMIAAVKYTVGKSAYGYKGLGDLFVFIFFGLVAVTGTTWLHTGSFVLLSLLPAVTIGLYSAAVLHINNIRDMENDERSGKYTLALKLGLIGSRIYLCSILFVGFMASTVYTFRVLNHHIYDSIWIFSTTPLLYVCISVVKLPPSSEYNSLLKMMSLATLMHAVLFSVMHWFL